MEEKEWKLLAQRAHATVRATLILTAFYHSSHRGRTLSQIGHQTRNRISENSWWRLIFAHFLTCASWASKFANEERSTTGPPRKGRHIHHSICSCVKLSVAKILSDCNCRYGKLESGGASRHQRHRPRVEWLHFKKWNEKARHFPQWKEVEVQGACGGSTMQELLLSKLTYGTVRLFAVLFHLIPGVCPRVRGLRVEWYSIIFGSVHPGCGFCFAMPCKRPWFRDGKTESAIRIRADW